MGIRVRKFLGYAFRDIVQDDPRIRWDSPLLGWESSLSGTDYLDWLAGRYPRNGERHTFSLDFLMLRETPGLRKLDLHELVSVNMDDRPAGVLAVRPASLPDWYRSDDSVDYVSETYLRDGGNEPRAEFLPAGIHPFNGTVMDARTGEQLPSDALLFARIMRDKAVREKIAAGETDVFDSIARDRTPFSSAAEAADNIVPAVPGEIRDICEYGSLLAEPDGWKDMRPVLLTWWS